jgi:lipid A disaccharide synthetase
MLRLDLNIIITTNGPGEIATWVQPVVALLRDLLPQARLIIALVPCPHSSGQEAQVSSRMAGTSVLLPAETLHYLLTGQLPAHIVLARAGVVLHLGGDQLFSVSLGLRSGYPVVVYSEKLLQWPRFVQRYLLRDHALYEQACRKIPVRKLKVVGDLMADAVHPTLSSTEARLKLNLNPALPVVSLLPGSKPLKVRYAASFLLRVADDLSQFLPEVQYILPQSPFTPLAQLREAVQDPDCISVLSGVSGKIVHDRNSTFIVTPQGNKIQVVPPGWNYNALQISDLSITLPGTNTAELAVLGVPMLVILPLNRPEMLPLDGLGGLLGKLPMIGPTLKKRLVQAVLKKMRFISIPNQKARRLLVPELVGEITAPQVAQEAFRLLADPLHRREISLTLRRLMPAENAPAQLISALIEVFETAYPRQALAPTCTPLDSTRTPDSDSASGSKRTN